MTTQTSARGSRLTRRGLTPRGFTLIELLVVVVLIAVASSLASLALRDPAATRLDQDGARLAALLDAARAEARSTGLMVTWAPSPPDVASGFRFVGLPATLEMPSQWLDGDIRADVVGARAVLLGPEPVIGAQAIVLRLANQRLTLTTDGIGPFVAGASMAAPN